MLKILERVETDKSILVASRKARRATYQAKCEAEWDRFTDLCQRDDQKGISDKPSIKNDDGVSSVSERHKTWSNLVKFCKC